MAIPTNWSAFTERQLPEFIAHHRLPAEFRSLSERFYLPLADWIIERRTTEEPLFLGINGAQGTGKSTLAEFLAIALESTHEWRVAVLSIDDFYLTREERENLATEMHPLLQTRGVPGTHDLGMLISHVDTLQRLPAGEEFRLPRFDKSIDDRAIPSEWPTVTGTLDLIILEGWCVGSGPTLDERLDAPINDLERDEDASGEWRRYVNERLHEYQRQLFQRLDSLVFLKAPNFDAVYRWRLEQEQKLADRSADDAIGIMDEQALRRFMQFYERITQANLETLVDTADVLLELGDDHSCVACSYR